MLIGVRGNYIADRSDGYMLIGVMGILLIRVMGIINYADRDDG